MTTQQTYYSASLPDSVPLEREQDNFLDHLSGAFFRRIDWAAFWTVFIISLGVYTYTLAPTVTLEDSGELAVASDFLGVPHPPGYPIWTLVTWFFQWIFHFVTFHGHPNPAWGVGFASAVAGAGACGVLALLISRSGAELIRSLVKKGGDAMCFVSAVSGGLLLTFSPVLWSQSVIVEVYSLNALFQMLILLLIYMWMCRPKSDKLLYVAAFLFGLGLTNHQTLLFLGLALAVAVMMKDTDLFRDFAVAAICIGVVFGVAALGVTLFVSEEIMQQYANAGADGRMWKWMQGPDHAFFWIYTYAFVAIPIAIGMGTLNANQPLKTRFLRGAAVLAALYLLTVLCFQLFATPGAKAAASFSPWLFPALRVPTLAQTDPQFLKWLWTQGPGNHVVFLWAVCLLAPLALCLTKLPHGKTVAFSILLAELGVAFYLYLPIASEQNPPMNWGYARTWQGFMHAVTRGQYDAIIATDIFSDKFINQLGAYLTDLRSQFTLPVAILGFLPFCAWGIRINQRRISVFVAALSLVLLASFFIVLETVLGWGGAEKIFRPLIGLLLLISVWGIFILFTLWIKKLITDLRNYSIGTIIMSCFFLLGLFAAVLAVDVMSLSAVLNPEATPLLKGFFLAVVFGPIVAVAATLALHLSPLKLDFELAIPQQRWLITSIIGFISVSILFLIFQNPSLDIQNLFIGRVQFIQSHAFYALWIGYGALLGIACLAKSPVCRSGLLYAGLAVVLLLPAVLLWQNAYDEEQIRIVGGAEQNGHDFGWQFGNWSLQGVTGIEEDLRFELSEEEFEKVWAAYPTPGWPPPMASNAVFYGGTDPGRFVPTYMIYSAEVRQDVYLITQNALADNTFMNITRDLYGDTIYIPSGADSDAAFQQYMLDVQAGRIPAGAEIKVENGRMSVQGVQGVMTINGILAKLIFEKNKFRHDFYVEESYPIEWMYPYLTPHGLILKLNKEPLAQIPADIIENDHKFWTWYCDFLLSNSKFTRDICARKSFSKLRSAIAGIYRYRGNIAEAEFAYKQAIAIYPLSPEAVLHLAQLYMNTGRTNDAEELVREFTRQDPNSDAGRDFLRQIENNRRMGERRLELEEALRTAGAISMEQGFELVQIYRAQGQQGAYRQLAGQLVSHPEIPLPYLVHLARFLANDGQLDLLATALENYSVREPNNAEVWLDLAATRALMGQNDVALTAVRRALQLGGQAIRQLLVQDPRFSSLANHPEFRQLLQGQISPGGIRFDSAPSASGLPNLPGLVR